MGFRFGGFWKNVWVHYLGLRVFALRFSFLKVWWGFTAQGFLRFRVKNVGLRAQPRVKCLKCHRVEGQVPRHHAVFT